jgi:hypothetical protein
MGRICGDRDIGLDARFHGFYALEHSLRKLLRAYIPLFKEPEGLLYR